MSSAHERSSGQARRPGLPIDPDLPMRRRVVRRGLVGLRRRWDILLVIAAGGALGSAARYLLSTAMPHNAGEIPWATVTVNVVGCFLLGLLMVFVIDVWPPNRYLRPFLGVGVLGGLTTFSTYTMDTWTLVNHGHHLSGMLYLLGSVAAGLTAVWTGLVTGRVVARRGRARAPIPDLQDSPTPSRRSR